MIVIVLCVVDHFCLMDPLHRELSGSQIQKSTAPHTHKRHMLRLLGFRFSTEEVLITHANLNLEMVYRVVTHVKFDHKKPEIIIREK